MQAIIRGTTRYPRGLVAITRRASICSVTFMVLISAVMAEPVRPAATTPTSTGPSSLPTAIATMPPTVDSAPNLIISPAICKVITMPVNSKVRETIGSVSTPRWDI